MTIMKSQLLCLILIISASVRSQQNQENNCIRLRFLASEELKVKNYTGAASYYLKGEKICGGYDAKNYARMIGSFRYAMNSSQNKSTKTAYADTIERVYTRAEFAGAYNTKDDLFRAGNILQSSAPERVKADKLFRRGIDASGTETNEAYVSFFYYNTYAMWYEETDAVKKEDLKERLIGEYLELSLLINQANMSDKTQETITGYYNDVVKTNKVAETNFINGNENVSSKGGYCMKTLSSNISNEVTSFLTPSLMNLINNEFIKLEKFFHLDVNLTFADQGPSYWLNSNTIYTGNSFINSDLSKRQKGSYVYEVYKAILAHEFAHALQHQNGMFIYWKEGKQPELHADFLAGFYMGKNGLVSKHDLKSFVDEFFELGDYNYFDADHHGTPVERSCAFLEGYKVAIDYNFNIFEAYNAGIDYIKLIYPCDAFAIIKKYSKTEYNNTNYTLPTGNYVFSSTEENMVFCNLYKQPLGEAMPGKDLVFNNLAPGSYIVIPAKKQKSGNLKYYEPYTFVVKPNRSGQLTIKQVGKFAIRTYSITF